MNANDIKKLDEETRGKLTNGVGPSDECLCSILAPQDAEKKGFRQSIKKAFASIGQARPRRSGQENQGNKGLLNTIELPLAFTKGGKGIYTTKETVKSNCGKCGCAKENIVMKHSFANIRISSPDISNICPCPSDCLPAEKAKLANNIKVTIERLSVDTPTINPGPDERRTGRESGQGSLDTLDISEESNSRQYTEDT